MRFRFVFIEICFLFFETSCSINESNSEICFIGDSIIQFWDLEYFFPGYYIHKHAVGGARIQDIDEWDVSDCKGLPVFFLMGTNNIGYVSVESREAYSERNNFLGEFLPRIQLIDANPLWVISILPRNLNGKQSSGVNQNIELLNNQIQNSLDSLGTNYKFIDVFDYFLEDDYRINFRFFKDGVHPNAEGYVLLTSVVQKKL
jgi:hypothetical protein